MSEEMIETPVETTETVETPEVVETEDKPTGEVETPSSEDHAETEAAKDEEKTVKRNSFQERINQKTREAKEAQARAAELQERLAAYEQQTTQSQPRPKLEDFDYDESAFNAALDDWTNSSLSNAVRQSRIEEQRQEAQLAQQRTLALAQETFVERANDFELDHPDFKDTVKNVPNSQVLTSAVLVAEDGPALAYHLGKNPDLAQSLASMNPYMAMLEIGKISAKLGTPAPAKTTQAPAPSKPVGASASITKDPDKMTPEEYRKYRGYK